METGGIIFIIVVVIVAGIIISNSRQNERDRKVNEVLDRLKDFEPTDKYLSISTGYSIAYDDKRNKVCFIKDYKPIVYAFEDIMECVLDVDGETIFKQSVTGTIGRSVVGGVLAGGVGAIIGGTTGSKSSNSVIKNIDLKVTVNDKSSPIYRVNFLDLDTKKGSFIYNESIEPAERWYGILAAIIKQSEKGVINESNELAKGASIADELMKFKQLLDVGAITQDEYDIEKGKLLKSRV